MTILHLLSDPRLVGPVVRLFRDGQGVRHRIVVLVSDMRSLKEGFDPASGARLIEFKTQECLELAARHYSSIWVHGASTPAIRFVMGYSRSTKVVWVALGPDYRDYIGRWDMDFRATMRWCRRTPLKRQLKRIALYLLSKARCLAFFSAEHGFFFNRVDFYAPIWPGCKGELARLLAPRAVSLDFAYDKVWNIDALIKNIDLAPRGGSVLMQRINASRPKPQNGITIRFGANGGRGKMADVHIKGNQPIILPRNGFDRPGYRFVGWTCGPKATVMWEDGVRVKALPTHNGIAVLYAVWQGVTCTVRFNANGGSGSMPDLELAYGVVSKLPANRFKRRFAFVEYEFLGWAKNPAGHVIWKDGAVIKEPVVRNGVATLYAVWKGFRSTIHFVSNGGQGQMPDFSFTYGQAVRLPRTSFMRERYLFAGWSDSAQGKVKWKDGACVKDPPHRSGAVVFYAIWRGVPCRVSFDANGGVGRMPDFKFAYSPDLHLPSVTFSREGYSFMGWSRSTTGPIEWKDGYCLGSEVFPCGEIVFYARWRRGSKAEGLLPGRASFGPRHPLRILHFVGARLYVDGIINTFERIPETMSRYVLITGDPVYSTAGIKRVDRLEVVQRHGEEYKKLLKTDEFDVIWVHGAAEDSIRYCLNCEHLPVVVWSTWGFDYIDYVGRWWFMPRTTWYWIHSEGLRLIFKKIALWLIAKLRFNRLMRSEHGRFFKLVDFFSCVLPEESHYLRRVVRPSARQIFYAYLQKLEIKRSIPKMVDLDRKTIWVGNSATLPNNYWDLFPKLAKEKDYRVVCSLVYGPDGVTRGPYAEPIENCARHYIGDRFRAITTFLPLSEYAKLMDDCAVFIFGQLRQQAVGNILLALQRGGCVFLHKNSPVYAFCMRKKFKVYTLEDLDRGIENVLMDYRQYQAATAAAANKVSETREVLAKIRRSVRQIRVECEARASSAKQCKKRK